MGTMTFGQQSSESESHELLDYCLSRGVNFLDTAEVYSIPIKPETAGKSEEIIGTWLKKNARDKVVVATKVCPANFQDSSFVLKLTPSMFLSRCVGLCQTATSQGIE